MARRLLAFALALVIIGAPLAGNACGAFCAAHVGHAIDPTMPVSHHHSSAAASQGSHHHHADVPPVSALPTGFTALRPASHECAQPDAILSESRELTRAPIVGVTATVARVTPALARALPSSHGVHQHRPAAPISSALPLRI
jgi:hypothetical protein